jgi:Tfp pilus assembly protein PilF
MAGLALAACSSGGTPAPKATVACTRDNTPAALLCAKRTFEQVVKNDPKQKFGWYNLGVIAQGDHDPNTAARDYRKAIAIDPAFESPLYNLGVLRLQAGNYRTAAALLNRAVVANPKDANALFKLASALVHLHTAAANEQAKIALNSGLRLDPPTMGFPTIGGSRP